MSTTRYFGRVMIISEPYLKQLGNELIPVQDIAVMHRHKSDISYSIILNNPLDLYECIFFTDILSLKYQPGIIHRD